MLINRMRLAMLTLLVVGSVATGLGYLTHSLAKNDEPRSVIDGQRPASTQADAPSGAAPGRIFIVGRVLNPLGKPVPNANVMAYARLLYQQGNVIGQTQSDGSGLFRLDALRSSSERREAVGAVALAPGYGFGWVEFDPDAHQPTADISLRPEQVINGRLFDLQGQPAQSVRASVSAIRRVVQRKPDQRREQAEGPIFWRSDAKDLPGWPGSVITDSGGRFTMRGVGRDLRASLTVHDSRFAQQDIQIETDSSSESKQLTAALKPAQIITGRIAYADTGEPVSDAWVSVAARNAGRGGGSASFKANNEGRFRANPAPGDHFVVYAVPPEGQPYLGLLKEFEWPKGAVEHSVDLALPRGVTIRGKVTEQSSGKAIAGATVTLIHIPGRIPSRGRRARP
jgi:hypothetical protein